MINFPTSLAVGLANPSVDPMQLIELGSCFGTDGIAGENCVFGGVPYTARLTTPVEQSSGQAGLPAAKVITIPLANPDGYYSQWRPDHYRNYPVTIREVLRSVDSAAYRVQQYTLTALSVTPQLATFEAVDIWGTIGNRLVPGLTLTTSLYPFVPSGVAGTAATLLYGRCLCPLRCVDAQTPDFVNYYTRFFACVGSATWGSNTPTVVQAFNGTLQDITSFTLNYAVVGGVPVTEVLIPNGLVNVQYYADLQNGPTDYAYPDAVLLDLLYNPAAGGAGQQVLVDSASLLTARSWYQTVSLGFSCALTTQQALSTYVGNWTHDAVTFLTLRDKLRLTPQNSRGAVDSLYVGTILQGQRSFQDAPIGTEQSDRIVNYTERTRPQQGVIRYTAGSGSSITLNSPFLGSSPQAATAAQLWAKRAYYGRRIYTVQTTLAKAALEPGDIVTLTHSLLGANTQLCEITGQKYTQGIIEHTLSEVDPQMWITTGLPQAYPFLRFAQFFPITQSYALNPTFNSFGVSGSHQLFTAPVFAQAVWVSPLGAPTGIQAELGGPGLGSGVPATNSTFMFWFGVTGVNCVANLATTVAGIFISTIPQATQYPGKPFSAA